MLFSGGESIFVKPRPDITRRLVRKRIISEKIRDLRSVLEQALEETDEPWVLPVIAERGEPHLTIEPRLVRRIPPGRPVQCARLPSEFVPTPLDAVRAA